MRKYRVQIGAIVVVFLCSGAAYWAAYTPVQSLSTKSLILFCPLLAVASLVRIWPRLIWPVLVLGVLLLSLFLFPGRPVNSAELRNSYAANLQRYTGVQYVWGGETGRGIDCSGLIRRAWEDTLWQEGWRTRNPVLWREAAFVWWFDCTAKEMGTGYRGHIQSLFSKKSLNELDHATLQPGDLAVTSNGLHILAYIGKGQWIQADPNLVNGGDKVIITKRPTKNGWFRMPVDLRRWKLVNEGSLPGLKTNSKMMNVARE